MSSSADLQWDPHSEILHRGVLNRSAVVTQCTLTLAEGRTQRFGEFSGTSGQKDSSLAVQVFLPHGGGNP